MNRPARRILLLAVPAILAALAFSGCESGTSKAVKLTSGNFEEIVLKNKLPVLVDFWAEWCGPCKMMDPVIKELAVEFEGKVVVAKVNIDDYPAIANKYGVQAIPTFLIFKAGELTKTVQGVVPKHYLANQLQPAQ